MLLFTNNNLTKTIFFMLLFAMFTPMAYGDNLDYQDRGDRWEGIKPQPVSGQGIELLSVLAYYGEKWQSMPTHCKLKFYLPEQRKEVNLKVREVGEAPFASRQAFCMPCYYIEFMDIFVIWVLGGNGAI